MAFSYQVFLAHWAKRLSWKETSDIFQTSWDTVFRAVQFVVVYGLAHQLSSGAVEGLNLKAKLTIRKAYGFKTLKCLEVALYHTLGALPEPEYHHRFC
jgi:transposase